MCYTNESVIFTYLERNNNNILKPILRSTQTINIKNLEKCIFTINYFSSIFIKLLKKKKNLRCALYDEE